MADEFEVVDLPSQARDGHGFWRRVSESAKKNIGHAIKVKRHVGSHPITHLARYRSLGIRFRSKKIADHEWLIWAEKTDG